jgi:hypothetical protein
MMRIWTEVMFALGGDHRYRGRNRIRYRLLQTYSTDCDCYPDPDTDPDGYILLGFLFDIAKRQPTYELMSNSCKSRNL